MGDNEPLWTLTSAAAVLASRETTATQGPAVAGAAAYGEGREQTRHQGGVIAGVDEAATSASSGVELAVVEQAIAPTVDEAACPSFFWEVRKGCRRGLWCQRHKAQRGDAPFGVDKWGQAGRGNAKGSFSFSL